MKTEFYLDFHKADYIGAKINIIGKRPLHRPYVSINVPPSRTEGSLFIHDNHLELFAVNILKALKSNKLVQHKPKKP